MAISLGFRARVSGILAQSLSYHKYLAKSKEQKPIERSYIPIEVQSGQATYHSQNQIQRIHQLLSLTNNLSLNPKPVSRTLTMKQ